MYDKRIIVYDANCKFCIHFANWCIKKQSNLTIFSVRDNQAKTLLRNVGIKFIDLQTIYFIDNEKVFVRSKAIFKILGSVGLPWKMLTLFTLLPVHITDYFYKLFAKYRYYF